jgi:subtilase family serine protease
VGETSRFVPVTRIETGFTARNTMHKEFFMKYTFMALGVLALTASGLPQSVMAQVQNTQDAESGINQPALRLGNSSPIPSRVIEHVDNTKLSRLNGNVHPLAQKKFDQGLVESSKLLERVVLVLKRSPEQEAALAAFNERQYRPGSPDFHRWLHAEEFGKLYGPNDADIAEVTNWLQNEGLQLGTISKGRVWIEFSGTVKQVQDAFHVEMHNYLVDGKMHIANDRDPQIPEALSPVVTGLASLNDFAPTHFSHPGNYVKRDLKTGKYTLMPPTPPIERYPAPEVTTSAGSLAGAGGVRSGRQGQNGGIQPEFGYVDSSTGYQREELSPYDVATIYNILPLWNASTPITGKGVKVAIVALSDVTVSDFNTYRSSFGLPAGTLTTMHSGADPGLTDSQGENTEDTEMVSATAPGATVVLVADPSSATTNGLVTAVNYIVDNEIAPILTMSYGACELKLGTAGNSLYNQTFQQGATAGISSFVAAGDSGSGVCTSQDGTPPYADTYGLSVSGMASTPYVTAVGGTDLQWPFVSTAYTTYWNATNDAHGASAKGYMPEMAWNDTCTNPLLLNVFTDSNGNKFPNVESLCNAAINGDPGLVEMGAGSGGASKCTTNSTTNTSTSFNPASCSGGYAKPSWQTGVAGIPADGKRDIPDISMFAAYGFQQSTGLPGSALLICQASESPEKSCDYSNPDYIIYQENGGTSAASPMTAGVMALVLQKVGTKQGLANPVFYSLAAKESYASCNTNTVKAGNSCIFYDTTSGSNAAVCITGDTNCVTNTAGDQAGILSGYSTTTGYDLATGLGSFNVTNLVNAWPTAAVTHTLSLSPTSLAFGTITVGATSAAQVVTVKNTGTGALTLTSETVSAPFVKSATTCATTLAVGASCTVSVEYKPASATSSTGTLTVASNGTSTPASVALTGTGKAASTLTLSLSPTSIAFGTVTVGTTSAAHVVTVKNTGTSALTLTSEIVSAPFVKSATTCTTTLAVGASCTVSVEYKPTATGASTGTVVVASNGVSTPASVALTGTGTAAATPTLTLTPTSIAFPNTIVGSTSDAVTVVAKNSSTSSITLSSITLGGTNTSSFELLDTCGATLAAGASCNLYIAFKPTSAAALSGYVAITDNASGSPQKVTLNGTGTVAPSVKLSTTSLTFPTTTHGTTSDALPITLTNSGTATLNLISITLTGTNPTDFEALDTCGATLAPSASCTVYVGFKPAAAAAYTAKLTVTDNGAASPQSVTLTGTGK